MDKFKTYIKKIGEVGFVEEVLHSIAYARGIPHVKPYELVVFETGEEGQVLSLSEDLAEILVFSDNPINPGTQVARTGKELEIPADKNLLGSTIDPLGHSYDKTKPSIKTSRKVPINTEPQGIHTREKVMDPLETGITIIDLLIPLGKGQRELFIGDRKTGKTKLLLSIMLNQTKEGTICIYTGIAKRNTDIREVEDFLTKHHIKDKTVVVASNASDPLGTIFLTPYSAMAVAEFFRDLGNDVLIIFDDLTTHAKYYREISLLGKKYPGRSSFPGDIFYTHARLLERAGNFKTKNGVKSITCLPVAQTLEGDISGYIETNLMAATDGHIYFDKELFKKGHRPAINYFLSVTRVGRQTQNALRREVTRELSTFLILYEKTQGFVHFGAELGEDIKTTIRTGENLSKLFNQTIGDIIPPNLQLILYTMIWVGTWNNKESHEMLKDIETIKKVYAENSGFRKKLDNLVQSSSSQNELIGKISGESSKILTEATSAEK